MPQGPEPQVHAERHEQGGRDQLRDHLVAVERRADPIFRVTRDQPAGRAEHAAERASGTGRFIADSWFSDAPLPRAYTVAEAAPVRQSGGVSAKTPDLAAIDAYLAQVDIPLAIAGMKIAAEGFGGLRGE